MPKKVLTILLIFITILSIFAFIPPFESKVEATMKFTTYDLESISVGNGLTALDVITNMCYKENGHSSITIAAEASQMANLFEVFKNGSYHGETGVNGFYHYITNTVSGELWYAVAQDPSIYTRVPANEEKEVVKKVLQEGLRTLPIYVTEHGTWSTTEEERKACVQHKTIVLGFIFYCFPGNYYKGEVDPFGYYAKDKEAMEKQYGEADANFCYEIDDKGNFNGTGSNYSESDDNLGGRIFNPVFTFIAAVLDAFQQYVGNMMTNENRKLLVAEDVSGHLNADHIAYNGRLKNIEIRASDNIEDIEDWPSDVDISEEMASVGDDWSEVESDDSKNESLGGNQYFIDVSGYRSNYKYPQIVYSPEEIFSGKVEILNANFISSTPETSTTSPWSKLRGVVQQWFRALRYLGLAGLLAVLIYIGIKIMISSGSSKKAKYKQNIADWTVSILLMFLLPYIMSFTFAVSDSLIGMFNDNGASNMIEVFAYDGNAGSGHEGKLKYTKFTTNITGIVRFQIQSRNLARVISCTIMYFMLIVYTLKFTFTYLKRMAYMAVLTILSPIVAFMYPIDKLKGGHSKAFSMWLKEYIFNSLLQPFHLLIYYVFVSSAMSFATENVIYVIVVLAFMHQAEKILKKIFGFDKAKMGTIGSLADSVLKTATFNNLLNTGKNIAGMFTDGKKKNPVTQNKDLGDYRDDYDTENALDEDPDYDMYTDNLDEEFDLYNERKEKEKEKEKERIENERQEMSDFEDNYIDPYLTESGVNERYDKLKEEEYERLKATQDEKERKAQKEKVDKQRAEKKEAEKEKYHRKLKAPKGTKEALKTMASKRLLRAKMKAKGAFTGVNKKKIIKGVAKVAKVGASVAIGAGATVGQAAFSLAMDGKYNPLEGITTMAVATVGANKILNKPARKISGLVDEYYNLRQGANGQEYLKQQLEEDYWKNSNIRNQYEAEYAQMSPQKLETEMKRGARLAREGITSFEAQKQVATFAQDLTDQRFESQYSGDKYASNEEREQAIHAKAEELRNSGDKRLKGLTDEDVVKEDIMKKGNYEKLAINTYRVKKEIPVDVRKGDRKKKNEYVQEHAIGQGDREALARSIEMTNRFDRAQTRRKERKDYQRVQYAHLNEAKANKRK